MDYKIALSPTVSLDSAEFEDAWNADPGCRAVAVAQPDASPEIAFDPLLASAALTVLSSVAAGLATNIIYDLIKEVLFKKGEQRQVDVAEVPQPDGSRLIVVTIREGD